MVDVDPADDVVVVAIPGVVGTATATVEVVVEVGASVVGLLVVGATVVRDVVTGGLVTTV